MVTISMISSLILVPLLSAYLQARVVGLTECTAIRQGLSCLMWSPTRSRTGPLRPGTFSSSWGRSASSSQWLYCLCKLYSVIICCTKAAHHSVMLKIKLYNDNSWKVNEKTPVIIILKLSQSITTDCQGTMLPHQRGKFTSYSVAFYIGAKCVSIYQLLCPFSLLMYYYWLRGQGYKKTEELLQDQLKMVCIYGTYCIYCISWTYKCRKTWLMTFW